MSAVEMSSADTAASAADEVCDRDMIVYDREGELYLRKKSFMGNTRSDATTRHGREAARPRARGAHSALVECSIHAAD